MSLPSVVFVVVEGVKALAPFVMGTELTDIYSNFANFYRKLTSEPQLRWVSFITHETLCVRVFQSKSFFQMPGLKLSRNQMGV